MRSWSDSRDPNGSREVDRVKDIANMLSGERWWANSPFDFNPPHGCVWYLMNPREHVHMLEKP